MASILHLTTVHPRSDTRILIKEARTLASKLPHKVLLMVADGKGNLVEEPGGVSIHDMGRLGGGRMGRLFFGSWRAFLAIRRLRPAIVHFHDPELMPLGVLLKAFGCKIIYDVHKHLPRQILSKIYIPKIIRYPASYAMAGLEWMFSRMFNAIIPATPIYADRFPGKKTVVVHNFPIGNELVVPDPTPYLQRTPSFAYLGGIETIRGAVEMIRAFECLGDISGARLELAGDFNPPALEAALRALPGWTSVHYHGQVGRSQVARILSGVRAGLVVLHPEPTHFESYPIKMFEYMSVGLPVIASDFPVWRRIIDGAGCGILVDPLNPESIADAMRWILEHPAEAEAMGRRGRQAVERAYNWDTEAAKMMGLYNKLLAH